MRHTDVSRRYRGFTLIELVTVLVILGILATTVAPMMFAQTPFDARGYADELAGAIQYAQSVAVETGCEVQFRVAASGTASPGYSAWQPATTASCGTGGAWSTPVQRNDGSGTSLSNTMPTDITVSPSVQFAFDVHGRISGAGPASIRVNNAFTVAVDPVSGYVTVQ
jgi:prepilin-type N-terminal cleavage/methylation domain-containing protein